MRSYLRSSRASCFLPHQWIVLSNSTETTIKTIEDAFKEFTSNMQVFFIFGNYLVPASVACMTVWFLSLCCLEYFARINGWLWLENQVEFLCLVCFVNDIIGMNWAHLISSTTEKTNIRKQNSPLRMFQVWYWVIIGIMLLFSASILFF